MKEKKKGNEKWKERKDYLGASNLREEKEKRKRETRVCNLRVLTFDRYPSKKGELLFLQWVLRNRCLEIMLVWEYKCSEESRWWIRFTDFFQGIESRVSWRKSVENIRRNFGNFFFFPFFDTKKIIKEDEEDKGGSKRKSYLRYLERIAGDCDFIIHRGWLWPLIFIAGSSLSFNIVERKPVLWNFHANLFTWAGSRTGVNQPRPE